MVDPSLFLGLIVVKHIIRVIASCAAILDEERILLGHYLGLLVILVIQTFMSLLYRVKILIILWSERKLINWEREILHVNT